MISKTILIFLYVYSLYRINHMYDIIKYRDLFDKIKLKGYTTEEELKEVKKAMIYVGLLYIQELVQFVYMFYLLSKDIFVLPSLLAIYYFIRSYVKEKKDPMVLTKKDIKRMTMKHRFVYFMYSLYFGYMIFISYFIPL